MNINIRRKTTDEIRRLLKECDSFTTQESYEYISQNLSLDNVTLPLFKSISDAYNSGHRPFPMFIYKDNKIDLAVNQQDEIYYPNYSFVLFDIEGLINKISIALLDIVLSNNYFRYIKYYYMNDYYFFCNVSKFEKDTFLKVFPNAKWSNQNKKWLIEISTELKTVEEIKIALKSLGFEPA